MHTVVNHSQTLVLWPEERPCQFPMGLRAHGKRYTFISNFICSLRSQRTPSAFYPVTRGFLALTFRGQGRPCLHCRLRTSSILLPSYLPRPHSSIRVCSFWADRGSISSHEAMSKASGFRLDRRSFPYRSPVKIRSECSQCSKKACYPIWGHRMNVDAEKMRRITINYLADYTLSQNHWHCNWLLFLILPLLIVDQ